MLHPTFTRQLASCKEDIDFTNLAQTVINNLKTQSNFGTLTNLAKFTEVVQKVASHWIQTYKSETSARRLTQLMEFAKSLIKSGLFKTQVIIFKTKKERPTQIFLVT